MKVCCNISRTNMELYLLHINVKELNYKYDYASHSHIPRNTSSSPSSGPNTSCILSAPFIDSQSTPLRLNNEIRNVEVSLQV